jgi:hypothetical protein
MLLSFLFHTQNVLGSSLTSIMAIPMGNPHIGVLITLSAFTMAIRGKQHIAAYVTELSFTNTRKHCKARR